MLLSRDMTLLVSDGGVIPSLFEARMKLPSCAITTISMLTSNGFLLCMETCLLWEIDPRCAERRLQRSVIWWYLFGGEWPISRRIGMFVRGHVVEAQTFRKPQSGQDAIHYADDLHLLPVSPLPVGHDTHRRRHQYEPFSFNGYCTPPDMHSFPTRRPRRRPCW